jgi:UDP-N-acetylmuramoyl-tripeptide--D-alanyl-D-alanine ligase
MIAHILGRDRRVVKAQGSYNNHVGVPLTIFQADEGTDVAVVEVGTNHPGEMAALGRVVRPDVAVLVSVGAEHLEGLGSIEGVVDEELSFLDWLRSGGRAVVHEDPRILARLRLPAEKRVVFGLGEAADVRAEGLAPDLRFRVGDVAFRLPLLGEWNALNALAASAACGLLGVPLEDCARRLEDFRGPKMRMERLELAGVTLINDAYNSNPESAFRAVREFSRLPARGRRVAVLGDMRELGAHAERYHRELGGLLSGSAVDVVVAVGAMSETVVGSVGPGKEIHRFRTVDELRPFLGQLVREGDSVLLKGSRSVGLERVVKWMGERVA